MASSSTVGDLSPLAFRFARFHVQLAGVDLAFWAAVDEKDGSSKNSVFLENAQPDGRFQEEGLAAEAFSEDIGENIRCGMVYDSVPYLRTALTNLQLTPQHHVLELGAGMGLPGLCAAASFGAHVVLSDRHPGVLQLLGRNVALNIDIAPTVEVRELSWTNKPAWLVDFDFVIAADVLYAEDTPPLFFMAAATALKPGGRLIIAHKARNTCCDFEHSALPWARANGFELCDGALPRDEGMIEVLQFLKSERAGQA